MDEVTIVESRGFVSGGRGLVPVEKVSQGLVPEGSPVWDNGPMNETNMTPSYTNLSWTDRLVASVPHNPWSVEVSRHGDGILDNRVTVVRVESFDGVRILHAHPRTADICEVRVENYPNIRGRRNVLGRVVEFTAHPSFVSQWVEMAEAHAA